VRTKICIISTVGSPLIVFMRPHIEMLSEYYDVTLIANTTQIEVSDLLGPNVRLIPLKIERKTSLFYDLIALISLYFIFRNEKFLSIHSLMPKAGLLAMVAGYLACIPCRIHTFTGQVWSNKSGFKRWGLRFWDKIIAWCSTCLLADSFSQKIFLIEESVVRSNKIDVLANGSICGVDLLRFKPNSLSKFDIRSQLAIPSDSLVYLFLGRLNKDKGILDLAVAFSRVAAKIPNIYLLIVGPDEEGLTLDLNKTLRCCHDRYRQVGFTSHPERYMAASDVFLLPSYREGFGSVVIEAAASHLPAIVSNIYGLVDAVENGKTGMLHPPGDINTIEKYMIEIFQNKSLRNEMARLACERAHEKFSKTIVVAEMLKFYTRNLNFNG